MIISTNEVATLLGCSDGWVRQLVGDKKLLPQGKIGQSYIFKRVDVLRYKIKVDTASNQRVARKAKAAKREG